MEMTESASNLINDAADFAKEHNYEYITPEMLLMYMPSYDYFFEAFTDCGGDIDILINDLTDYFSNYLEQVLGVTPELSVGALYALSYAEQFAANSSRLQITISHILHGIWQLEDSYAVYFIEKQNIKIQKKLEKQAS